MEFCGLNGRPAFLGTTAVAIGFSLIFSVGLGASYWWTPLWYGSLITLFQIGWATVQISHLSIIPSISRDHTHSADLTTIRYTASVCCGITVYLITWAILRSSQVSDAIGPDDFYKFREIALIITFIGISSSLLFYCGARLNDDESYEALSESDARDEGFKERLGFLRSSVIYQVSLLYMASRLFTTLNLIYIPLYLNERQSTLNPSDDGIRQAIASVPLASFLASFAMSLALKWRPKYCKEKILYLLGSILSLMGCLWIGVGVASDSRFQIYAVASLIGMGSSTTMISSLCITANFARSNGLSGGSVYSTVTFTDKFICGGIVLIVQHLKCGSIDECPNFYRHVLAYVCSGATVIGIISLGFLHCN